MHPALAQVVNPDGSRRFYEAGEHPAIFRERMMVERLEAVIEISEGPEGRRISRAESHAALEYHRMKIAEFEAGEHRAKCDFLNALAEREGKP